VIRFALFCLFALLSNCKATAHEWYDPWCCNNRDCKPYPAESVTETPVGYRLATGEVVPYRTARVSMDTQFHRCALSNNVTRCFYSPRGGS